MGKYILLTLLSFSNGLLFAQVAAPPPPITSSATTTSAPLIGSNRLMPVKTDNAKAAMMANNDITANIARTADMSKFYSLMQTAGLMETFKSKGPITIFVPDNKAFEKVSKGRLDTLMQTKNKTDLVAMLSYHALAGSLTSKDIAKQIRAGKGKAVLVTLTGDTLIAKIDDNRNILLTDEYGRQCMITKFDIAQSNGIMFITDGVLMTKPKL